MAMPPPAECPPGSGGVQADPISSGAIGWPR
jgi:hypothetical protein